MPSNLIIFVLMKKLVPLLLLVLSAVPAAGRPNVKWRLNNDLWYYFDNREFAASSDAILPSMTHHALVFVPTVEMMLDQGNQSTHSLVLGADLMHNMGSGDGRDITVPQEYLIYYDWIARTGMGYLDLSAGVFPRKKMGLEWSEAFFSDEYKFLDRNIEGLMLSWNTLLFKTEFVCDWAGQRGYDRKERFQLLSAGDWHISRLLNAGWNIAYHHYAGSEVAPGVVDNGLGMLWMKVDFATPDSNWEELSLRAGVLQGYHRNRPESKTPLLPTGGELQARMRYGVVELTNTAYYGGNQLPFYYSNDTAGRRLGSNLYFGQPMYSGFYDAVELALQWRIWEPVDLRVSARAHFDGSGFLGWQQAVSLRFRFDSIRLGAGWLKDVIMSEIFNR